MTSFTPVWQVPGFHDLTTCQLYELLQVRVNVFVVEQQCAYPELDAYDHHAEVKHLLGHDEAGLLVAYARLLPAGLSFSEVSIGRFVVRENARGHGVGHQLLQKALLEAQRLWPDKPIRIAAQDYLQRFYEQYGFLRTSDVFLDHGVSHIEMLKSV